MILFVMVFILFIIGMLGVNMIYGYFLWSNGILKKRGFVLSEFEVFILEIIFGIILIFCVLIFI